ncbi:MAG: hypothetical protein HC836_10920 [Richelia sp. RM2_1_2]|nr:hypothetical protein [Richelia sp. SM2_1_7]NJM22550.1 hypothetical protein [Richelia sp. SM1_7_0]NJN10762.1 hypothetical protein [Richelia sp. RM1_1_1]NJO26120.1 hypothetical protein [Richelia sp. SL_2_1]NJO58832.1 hypothetical protein [Richelia sp. RM2_1_2]
MNEENQEPKKNNTEEQKSDDSSRSPGVDRGSPGVDRNLSSSENTPKKNTEESNQDS